MKSGPGLLSGFGWCSTQRMLTSRAPSRSRGFSSPYTKVWSFELGSSNVTLLLRPSSLCTSSTFVFCDLRFTPQRIFDSIPTSSSRSARSAAHDTLRRESKSLSERRSAVLLGRHRPIDTLTETLRINNNNNNNKEK